MQNQENQWWKKSIMYQIYPRSFQDSNGDGIGDLRGIINRIDYIASLGVDLIWLGPVYESPNDDNGYDISDYYKIHPEFGTMVDFDELLEKLHARGIKLIMDLVVNHSSDEHAWFEESRKSKDNPYRDYYYWRDGKNGGPPNNWTSFFEGSAWKYDEQTDQYYLHLFTTKQPDLNWENPVVREEIYKMMRFWLDKGVDGFRMDVISLISKRLEFEDSPVETLMHQVYNYFSNGPRIHEFLKEMNREVLSKYDIVTVGEGPGITKNVALDYIGKDRNELDMIFQLDLMFLDNGPSGKFDRRPVSMLEFKKLMTDWNNAIGDRGWNNIFLDNHDFPRMVSRFGNDGKYRIESAKLLLTYLLTMRGTPCIYQGSEIGMTNVKFTSEDDYRDVETINYFEQVRAEGKDLNHALDMVHTQGRDNVRTPIQWDNSQQGGFSEGQPWIKINPNYTGINVEAADKDKTSILHFFRKMTAFRKSNVVLQDGDYVDLYPDHEALYIFSREAGNEKVYVLLNFSDDDQVIPAELKLGDVLMSNYEDNDVLKLLPWECRVCS